jgi:hypothetical protein
VSEQRTEQNQVQQGQLTCLTPWRRHRRRKRRHAAAAPLSGGHTIAYAAVAGAGAAAAAVRKFSVPRKKIPPRMLNVETYTLNSNFFNSESMHEPCPRNASGCLNLLHVDKRLYHDPCTGEMHPMPRRVCKRWAGCVTCPTTCTQRGTGDLNSKL